MKDYLLKKAYEFYPIQLNGLDETYMLKDEIVKLKTKLESSLNAEYSEWQVMLKDFHENNPSLSVLDKTNFMLSQPSFVFQIILDKIEGSILVFNCYCSLVIPYYYFTVSLNNISDNAYSILDINEISILPIEVQQLLQYIENQFERKLFPQEFLNEIIPNISFEAIEFDRFTYQQAFFNSRHIVI